MITVMMYVYLSCSLKSACLPMPEPTPPTGHIPLLYYATVQRENSQNVVWPARTVWAMLGMPISNAEQVSEGLSIVRYTVCQWIGWCGTLMCATSTHIWADGDVYKLIYPELCIVEGLLKLIKLCSFVFPITTIPLYVSCPVSLQAYAWSCNYN